MKQLCARLLVIAVLGSLLAFSAGCVLNDSDLVITDNICVDIDEVQTDGSFSTFVVADDFSQQLDKKLAQYGKSKKDVKDIYVVGGAFKTVKVNPHDWTVTAQVDIARQDDPNSGYTDGPAPLVSFTNQSLKALKGQPANLQAGGVTVVNNALDALLNGEHPRLVMIVNNESVTPTPTESVPMEFRTDACVRFQVVIAKTNGGGKK